MRMTTSETLAAPRSGPAVAAGGADSLTFVLDSVLLTFGRGARPSGCAQRAAPECSAYH